MEVPAVPKKMSTLVEAVTKGVCTKVGLIVGQASTRRYYRAHGTGSPATVVVMVVPDEDKAIEERVYPFLNVHRYLDRHKLPVPRILHSALNEGMIVLEDLGDETLEQARLHRSPEDAQAFYSHAISLIETLQSLPRDSDCLAFGRGFDFKLLRWELDHFRQWLLQEGRGVHLTGSESQIVETAFDRLAEELAAAPQVLVHRDFQSRNLMVDRESRLRVIDFQDALMGSEVYDLVALLRDSYVDLEYNQVTEFINVFAGSTNRDAHRVHHLFHLQTAQRKLKDAGRFVFIDRQRGNPAFLPSIPLSLSYVARAFANLPDYADLHAVLGRHLPELRIT